MSRRAGARHRSAMKGSIHHVRVVLVLAMLAGAACGGSSVGAPPCQGVLARGICWEGKDGITVSRERAERVFDAARVLWGAPRRDLAGWSVQFSHSPPVVDGERFDGYCFGDSRLIVVAPFAADCFERSAIFHELGHAWGFDHDDPRMSGEWRSIHDAMVGSRWSGCEMEKDD